MRFGKSWKHLLTAAVISSALFAAEEGVLFDVGYEQYELKADAAKGNPVSRDFTEKDLQLRMFPGVKEKSNSLLIANSERLSYAAKGNINPEQGTISLWLRMVDYDLGNAKLQSFFSVNDQRPGVNENYYFRIIKNGKEWKDFVIAQCYYKDPSMPKAVNRQVQYYLGAGKWKKGTWHHIAMTWDATRLSLYLDGKLLPPQQKEGAPRLDSEGKGVPPDVPTKTYAKFTFPQFSDKARMYVGNVFRIPGAEKTAFDRVQIFDRPLSAEEIQKLYESVIPPVKTAHPLNAVGIPCSDDPAHFTRCYMKEPMAKPAIKFNAHCDLRRDRENLYVRFVSDRPCGVKNITAHDGNLWEDDSFELHLKAPDEQYYQFIINGNGALFDRKNKDISWNAAKLKTAVTLGKEGWSAELVIPLKDLSPLPGVWKLDVCTMAATGRKKNYYRWSNVTFDGGFTATGEMRFLPEKVWFTIDRFGSLATGNLDLAARGSQGLKTEVSYTPINGFAEKFPAGITEKSWKTTLPAGNQTLNVTVTHGSLPVYQYTLDYYVDYPLELAFNTRAKAKKIDLQIDFANAGGERLKEIAQKGISGTLLLKDKAGKVYSEGSFKTDKAQCGASIPFPAGLIQGEYILEAQAGDMKRSIAYRVPNPAPYIEKIGDDATVPEPWSPVAEAGENRFAVWNRTYVFDGKSPFPAQIITGGDDLFVSAPQLTLNDEKAVWSQWKVTEKRGDRFTFAGEGKIAGVTVKFTSELWFDGMYLLNWELDAAQKTALKEMTISYTMPEKFAKFVFNPDWVPWNDGKVQITLLPDSSRKNNVMWLSGHERGLFFWTRSNANWVNHPKEAPLTATQKGKTVEAALKIITRPAELQGKAAYQMVFQAMPGRPLPKNFRTVNYLSFGRCAETHYELGNTGNGGDLPRRDDASVFNGCYPRDFKAFAGHWADRKVKNHMYTTPGHLSDYAPDFDMWDKEALSLPGVIASGKKLGIRQMSYCFCSNATDAPADLWTWWCNDAMKKLKNYNGLYFDLAPVHYCENEKHGCGGTDAFGQHYISSDALGLRSFFLRCYKTCHRNGGDMMIHCHTALLPMTHISDYFAPGEDSCSICQKNYRYGYCEDVPLLKYQTDYNQMRSGISYNFILQNGRAADLTPSMVEERKTYQKDRDLAMHALTPMVIHDINVWGHYLCEAFINELWVIRRELKFDEAKFHGYWEEEPAVTAASPRTYASYYEWSPGAPYRRLIVIGNLSRNAQKANLKIDFRRLGIGEKDAVFHDVWNNRPLSLADVEQLELQGASFALIGIK